MRRTSTGGLEEIVVTAQKRSEDLQSVPLSIQAFSPERLRDLNIQRFDDYVRFLPSVSYLTAGPGSAIVYMRGVSAGSDGNHSGSMPSVGMYLDEQPITTIQGALDVHLYDIARVEALAGPAGHPVRRQFAGGHDPHHHQPAGCIRFRRRLRPGSEYDRWRRHGLPGGRHGEPADQ